MTYQIARINCYYLDNVLGLGGVTVLEDVYGTPGEAFAEVARLDAEPYVTRCGEAGRPSYYVLPETAVAWLENDDAGKYDWPEEEWAEDPAGNDEQSAFARNADEEYCREHAVEFAIYLVENGDRHSFFANHMIGSSSWWGTFATLDEAKERIRELAEDDFRRENGEYDDLLEDGPNGEIDSSKADAALAEYVEECVNSLCIEWHNDLKWVQVAVMSNGGIVEVL